MSKKTIARYAGAGALAAALSLAAGTAASAEPWWGWGPGAVTPGAEYAAVAAVAAWPPYGGYYDYAPAPFYGAPYYGGPYYVGPAPGWGWSERPFRPGCGAGRPHCSD